MSQRILAMGGHEDNWRIVRNLLTSAGNEMIEAGAFGVARLRRDLG